MPISLTRRRAAPLLVSLLSLASSPATGEAQRESAAFESWAATRAIPVRIEASDSAADLRALRALVREARVVAYGEPTHGAHQPLSFRNRLFRFLVEQMGFTAIALESGHTEAEAVNRYVGGGAGELRDVVRAGISWGFGDFGENEELVAWMRAYNADPAHERKLRFYGLDLSGSGNGGFPSARRAVDSALAALYRRDQRLGDALRRQLAPSLEHFSTDGYARLTREQRSGLPTLLDQVAAALAPSARSIGSAGPGDWSHRNAVVARQLQQVLELSPPPGPGPGIPPEAFRAARARDSAMADNVRWALASEGADGRLMVFAHNNHVMNASITGGIWSAFRQPPPAMGRFLRASLGDQLLLLGTAGGSGADDLDAAVDEASSIDRALARAAAAPYVIDLRAARSSAAAWGWLTRRRPLHANGMTHVIVPVGEAFDALLVLDTLTGSRPRAR